MIDSFAPEKYFDFGTQYISITRSEVFHVLKHKNIKLRMLMAEPAEIMETLYYGVPVLLFSETDEQRAIAMRVQKNNCGYIVNENAIAQQITSLMDKDEYVNTMADAVEQLLKFEEKRGDRSLTKMIKYVVRFGADHLQQQENVGYRAIYDLDIKAGMILGFLCVIMGIEKLICK